MKKMVSDYTSQKLYSRIYSDKDLILENQQLSQYFINRVNIFGKYKKKRFLDAGCGMGMVGKLLKEQFFIEPYGIDISKEGVKQAKKNGVNAKVASLENVWPFESNFFDGVFSVQVIEHLVNPDVFLSEANRVLKKNGIIIITTPNLAAWFNRIIFLFGFQPFFLEVSTIDKTLGLKFTRKLTSNREPLGHVRGFTLRALCDILELHDFRIVKVMGGEVNYFPPFMKIIDKFFSFFPSLATDLIVVAKKK